jgi:hypothetical protein
MRVSRVHFVVTTAFAVILASAAVAVATPASGPITAELLVSKATLQATHVK